MEGDRPTPFLPAAAALSRLTGYPLQHLRDFEPSDLERCGQAALDPRDLSERQVHESVREWVHKDGRGMRVRLRTVALIPPDGSASGSRHQVCAVDELTAPALSEGPAPDAADR